jgi:segregation and condensation protein B
VFDVPEEFDPAGDVSTQSAADLPPAAAAYDAPAADAPSPATEPSPAGSGSGVFAVEPAASAPEAPAPSAESAATEPPDVAEHVPPAPEMIAAADFDIPGEEESVPVPGSAAPPTPHPAPETSAPADRPEPAAGPSAEPDAARALEAILFAAHEPLAPARLGALIGDLDGKAVRRLVEQLNAEYAAGGRAFRIEEIAGGFQILTRPEYNGWLRKLHKSRSEGKLSQTAMLTLAIIAYKQPIKRLDIESIRGAACGETIRALMDKGLVKIVGREESLGRPLLYGTTKKFLQSFGLASLKELPRVEELAKP